MPSPRLRFVLPLAFPALLTLLAHPARAAGDPQGEIAFRGGYGAPVNAAGSNPFGASVGIRGGASFYGVYAGINFLYHAGEGDAFARQGGAEVGYGVRLLGGALILRAQIGAGLIMLAAEPFQSGGFSGDGSGASPGSRVVRGVGGAYLEPGLVALVSLSEEWFVGADTSCLVIPDGTTTAYSWVGPTGTLLGLTVHAQLGVKFR